MLLSEARAKADEQASALGRPFVVYSIAPREYSYCSLRAWRTQSMFVSCEFFEERGGN